MKKHCEELWSLVVASAIAMLFAYLLYWIGWIDKAELRSVAAFGLAASAYLQAIKERK